jgi:hypothetical protein
VDELGWDRIRRQVYRQADYRCELCGGKGPEQARAHLARIDGWTLEQADSYISQAFQVWAQRSGGPWTLDLEGLRPYVLGNEYARIVRQAATPPERRRAIAP